VTEAYSMRVAYLLIPLGPELSLPVEDYHQFLSLVRQSRQRFQCPLAIESYGRGTEGNGISTDGSGFAKYASRSIAHCRFHHASIRPDVLQGSAVAQPARKLAWRSTLRDERSRPDGGLATRSPCPKTPNVDLVRRGLPDRLSTRVSCLNGVPGE